MSLAQPAWCRIRMQSNKWNLFMYDANMKSLPGYGPFDTIEEAEAEKARLNVPDRDKAK